MINTLLEQYKKLKFTDQNSCIKYHFLFKEVNVNIYFDAYDDENLHFSLILAYGAKYYFTTLNIHNSKIESRYLKHIPNEILNKILENGNLDRFYEVIKQKIQNEAGMVYSYDKDKIFTNTLKYKKDKEDMPFLHHLRKAKMTSETFKNLCSNFGISECVLEKIREEGFTIVRTNDPLKRKSLSIALKDYNLAV